MSLNGLDPRTKIKREVVVENVSQAIRAAELGADQIELCSHLKWDGLTPSDDVIEGVLDLINLPVRVMIRCRKGDFFYSEKEIETMITDIYRIKTMEMDGIVFGALIKSEDKIILDIDTIKRIAEAALPLSVTIHKAIDLCTDIVEEVARLMPIKGIRYILSSGGRETAIQGAETLRLMQETTLEKIQIIGAGKITSDNLNKIHSIAGLSYYHGQLIVGTLK